MRCDLIKFTVGLTLSYLSSKGCRQGYYDENVKYGRSEKWISKVHLTHGLWLSEWGMLKSEQ